MKRDHEQQLVELRSNLFDQYQQQLSNLSGSTFGLDNSFGERVREQVRLAQEFDRDDDERRQLLQQTTDHEELKRLVNKLHTEGKKRTERKRLLFLFVFEKKMEISFRFHLNDRCSRFNTERITRFAFKRCKYWSNRGIDRDTTEIKRRKFFASFVDR